MISIVFTLTVHALVSYADTHIALCVSRGPGGVMYPHNFSGFAMHKPGR